MLARVFEAVVWCESGMFASQLVDPVTLSYKKLKTILECRGLGYSGLAEKKDVSELVEKSGNYFTITYWTVMRLKQLKLSICFSVLAPVLKGYYKFCKLPDVTVLAVFEAPNPFFCTNRKKAPKPREASSSHH